jgi:hypothetical protein
MGLPSIIAWFTQKILQDLHDPHEAKKQVFGSALNIHGHANRLEVEYISKGNSLHAYSNN